MNIESPSFSLEKEKKLFSQNQVYKEYRNIFQGFANLFSKEEKGLIMAYKIIADIYKEILGEVNNKEEYLIHHILAGSSLKEGENSLIVDKKIDDALDALEEKINFLLEEKEFEGYKFSDAFLKKLIFFKNNLRAVIKN